MWNISTASDSVEQQLADLPGLDGAKRLVNQLILRQSQVHAVLFYGAEGVGKQALANVLVESWLRRTNEGEDRAVNAFRRGNNPDVLTIAPGGPSDMITIDRIVTDKTSDVDISLRDFFRSQPIQSRHKVAIFRRLDRMNSRSANSLLKTLEEPLPHAKIVLMTTEIGSVLPTIRSRCLSVACELPLMGPATGQPTVLEVLAEGSPGKLARLKGLEPVVNELAEWVADLAVAPPVAAIQLADRLASLADDVQKSEGTSARFADAQILALSSILIARHPQFPAEAVPLILKAHRAVIGNASLTITLDALITNLIAIRRRPNREPN